MNEVVRVLPTGGVWGQIGADIAPGAAPENLTCSVNEWGPDTASFTLRRDGAIPWNDLLPGSLVEIARDGVLGWSGRIEDVSADDGNGVQTVQAKGLQYHLDDDMIRRLFVHRSLVNGWKDWRSNLAATLANFPSTGQLEVGEGGMVFTHPAGAAACANMAYFDAGPGSTVKRVVITWAKNFSGNHGLYLISGNSLAALDARSTSSLINNALGAQSGTYSLTLTTAARYIGIACDSNSYTRPGDESCRVSAALLFADTAYESAGDSALTLDVLAKYLLTSGAVPLLSAATDRIETFGFGIPELDKQQRVTPRELLTTAQAFHDVRVQVDVDGKLVCQSRPSAPLVEVGSWSQHTFRDSSTSREPIASGVFVEGQGADGELIEVTRSSTINTLPQRQGYNKRNSLPIESAVTTALANQMGDVYLASHQTSPFKGEQVVQGWGDARSVTTGHPVHAFHMLRYSEEMMRFGDRIDPDTGAIGRDGRIKSITYNADTEESTITIDNESRRFEALAARMAAVVGS